MELTLFYALLAFALFSYAYGFMAKSVADKMLFSVLAIALCFALGAACLNLEMINNGTVYDISNSTMGITFMALAVAPVVNVYRYMFGETKGV